MTARRWVIAIEPNHLNNWFIQERITETWVIANELNHLNKWFIQERITETWVIANELNHLNKWFIQERITEMLNIAVAVSGIVFVAKIEKKRLLFHFCIKSHL